MEKKKREEDKMNGGKKNWRGRKGRRHGMILRRPEILYERNGCLPNEI